MDAIDNQSQAIERDIKILRVQCNVRNFEDAELNGVEDINGAMPFLSGELWGVDINVETGKICNWPKGNVASLHYKVCDEGWYALVDAHGEIAAEYDGYVPDMMSPGGSGYGDYVIMNIDKDGYIENWHADVEKFLEDHISNV